MTFDLKAARKHADADGLMGTTKWLYAACDEVERLHAELDRMAEMFAKDVYIESANLEPSHYDLRLKGKGCMLLAGQLTRMFYDSGGKNFITSTIEHQFSDGKDVFALTIQKMSGEDTPGQKIERQAKRIAELENSLGISAIETRDFQIIVRKQHAALKKLGTAKRERGKALVEERAKDGAKLPELCDIVHDELMCPALDGDCEHWEGCPRKDELRQKAREQLRREGLL